MHRTAVALAFTAVLVFGPACVPGPGRSAPQPVTVTSPPPNNHNFIADDMDGVVAGALITTVVIGVLFWGLVISILTR